MKGSNGATICLPLHPAIIGMSIRIHGTEFISTIQRMTWVACYSQNTPWPSSGGQRQSLLPAPQPRKPPEVLRNVFVKLEFPDQREERQVSISDIHKGAWYQLYLASTSAAVNHRSATGFLVQFYTVGASCSKELAAFCSASKKLGNNFVPEWRSTID